MISYSVACIAEWKVVLYHHSAKPRHFLQEVGVSATIQRRYVSKVLFVTSV